MKELDIKVGYQCNNNCIFCLNKDKKYYKEFPLEKLLEQITLFSRGGGEKLIISGGEPFTSKYLFALLAFAKKRGIKRLEIQTNGRTLFYEDVVRELKKFEPISYLISFHFPNDRLYRKYSQSDGFYQVMTGIKNLLKHNCNLTINTVIMKPNLFCLRSIVKMLKKNGVKKIQFRFIDGKNVINKYREFVPQYKESLPIVKETIKENPGINISLREFPICILNKGLKENLSPNFGCQRLNFTANYKLLTSEQIESAQFIFPNNCKNCIYKLACPGIRKEYVKIYGIEEFKPITN